LTGSLGNNQEWLDGSDATIEAIADKQSSAEADFIAVQAEIEEVAMQRDVNSAMQQTEEAIMAIDDLQYQIEDAYLAESFADEKEAKRIREHAAKLEE
jgi:hypothetical protein